MGIHTFEQDFADRYYKFFGGKKNFGYLVKCAKQFGVGKCESVIGEMKQDFGWDNKPQDARIKYFHTILWK